MMARLFRISGLILLMAATGCAPRVRELSRQSSPDNSIEAVTAVKETDATVDTPSEVYLVQRGGQLPAEPAFRADHVGGLSVRWLSNDRLAIHAAAARVFLKSASVRINTADGSRNVGVEYRVDHEER